MKKALLLGIVASFFFAFTFVLNRSMNLGGGYWLWSASLRYYFTLVILALLLVRPRKQRSSGKEQAFGGIRKSQTPPDSGISYVIARVKENPVPWIVWSTVGFGLFYAPLTAASIFAESWFTASIWQLTIVAGVLLTPLFGKRIPVKNVLCSLVVLAGIFIMQIPQMNVLGSKSLAAAFLLILIAAFSYPLGNRKMMAFCGDMTTLERVFGMTLCSMPFWIVCGIVSMIRAGVPGFGQIAQSICVALFSGVVATLLFFQATNLVKENPKELAVVEATQCGEVIFTVLLGVLVLGDEMPSAISLAGILVIVIGMILNSLVSAN